MKTGFRFGVGLAVALVAILALVVSVCAFGGSCLGARSMGDEPVEIVGSTDN